MFFVWLPNPSVYVNLCKTVLTCFLLIFLFCLCFTILPQGPYEVHAKCVFLNILSRRFSFQILITKMFEY